MGSRGSVIPFFVSKKEEGTIPITHPEMTRFNISFDEGVDMVMYALNNHLGGEIFVPKIPSYNIMDVAKAVAPDAKIEIVGIRPGEKLHEEMITETGLPLAQSNLVIILQFYHRPQIIQKKIILGITMQKKLLLVLNIIQALMTIGRQ